MSQRSISGFLIYVNTAFVQRLSKKQATVERSVFCAEFVTMKQDIDALQGLRYKLRMMAFPISGPSHIYGDNMSVVHNTARAESVLRGEKATQFAITQSVNQLPWISPSLGISLTKKMSKTYDKSPIWI